jgi:membrane carboxypeptidase/penicillin-binding protein
MALTRQKQVLHLMQTNGFITEEQRQNAEKEELTYAPNRTDIKAPHFVMYVRDELEKKYGKEAVEKGGLEVITTLDYRIQQIAEKAVKDEVDKLKNLNVGNGAAVVLNPTSGEILAMVGSKDYFDTKNDGNVNVAISSRQPGSSIKIVNYTYALSHGYTPASILDDTPVTFNIQGQAPYQPKNYDGKYRGKITLRSAFAESRNIPAVRILESYGVRNMIDMGQKMGITTWTDPTRFGLSLTLGGGEVKLVELANVYATIANYGKKPALTSVLEIKNYKGETIEEFACDSPGTQPLVAQLNNIATDVSASSSAQPMTNNLPSCGGDQVVDPRVAYMVTNILKDNDARSPAFGRNSALVIPDHPDVAVKTGTSNDLKDNLTVGYTPKYVVAVWVGNNDSKPMSRIASGVTGASPIFNKIMTNLLANEVNQEWQLPEGLAKLPICLVTGSLSCEGCPTKEEFFLNENQPQNHCNVDFINELKKKMEEQLKNKDTDNGNGNDKHQFWWWQ